MTTEIEETPEQRLERLSRELEARGEAVIEIVEKPTTRLNDEEFIGAAILFMMTLIQINRTTIVKEKTDILDKISADTTRILNAIESMDGPDSRD